MADVRAVFRFWQEQGPGVPPFQCYDVVGGPLDSSTVSQGTLWENEITVPETPTYDEWVKTLAPDDLKNRPAGPKRGGQDGRNRS